MTLTTTEYLRLENRVVSGETDSADNLLTLKRAPFASQNRPFGEIIFLRPRDARQALAIVYTGLRSTAEEIN